MSLVMKCKVVRKWLFPKSYHVAGIVSVILLTLPNSSKALEVIVTIPTSQMNKLQGE